MPTASVVIATYNKPELLAPTLACLGRQTTPVEVLVVDDASEPPLRGLPNSVRLIRREGPRHLQAARNQGIGAATGEILLLMDDDCLVREDYVQQHLWRHARDPGHLVSGNVRRIRYRGEPRFWTLPAAETVEEFRTHARHVERIPDNPAPWCLVPCSNNVSIARDSLLQAGGYDEEFFGWGVDDVEVTYRLLMSGEPLLMDSAPWVYHQEHPRYAQRQAEEERRNLTVFARRHGFWAYGDPPPGSGLRVIFPPQGVWFHARSILREGEPAAIQVCRLAGPVARPRRQRWPLDWILGAPVQA